MPIQKEAIKIQEIREEEDLHNRLEFISSMSGSTRAVFSNSINTKHPPPQRWYSGTSQEGKSIFRCNRGLVLSVHLKRVNFRGEALNEFFLKRGMLSKINLGTLELAGKCSI